jgi:Leucine-rich repeat (LRR) protein
MPPPQYFDSLLSTLKLEYIIEDKTLQKKWGLSDMQSTKWLGLHLTDYKKIPSDTWENLRALEVGIYLNDNQDFPTELYKAKNIRVLRVRGKNFSEFPVGLSNLSKLDSLVVYTEAEKINFNGELKKLLHLRSIKLSLRKKQKVPQEIKQLSSLSGLSIEVGESQEYYFKEDTTTGIYVLDDLSKMSSLRRLSLSGDSDSIIINRKNLPNQLIAVDITFHNIKTIPHKLFDIGTIQSVFINCNKVQEIPKSILNLKDLRAFSLMSNIPRGIKPTKIPQQLLNKPTLKILKLRNNTILEKGIYPNIELLEYHYAYSGGIEMFPNLKRLTFNELREYCNAGYDSIKLNSLLKLEVLKFIDCDLNKIPAGMENLKNLKHLSFYDSSQLRDVPDEILTKILDKLYNLEELDIREAFPLKSKYLIEKYPRINIKYKTGMDFEPFKY